MNIFVLGIKSAMITSYIDILKNTKNNNFISKKIQKISCIFTKKVNKSLLGVD